MDADGVVIDAGLDPRTRLHYESLAFRSIIAIVSAERAEGWLMGGGFTTVGPLRIEEARPCRIWAAPATADAAVDDSDRASVALVLAAELQRVLEVHGVAIQPCERVGDFGAADLAIWGAEDDVPRAVADAQRDFFGDGFLQVVDAGVSRPTTTMDPVAPVPTNVPNTGSGRLADDDDADGLSSLAAAGVAAAAAVVVATAASTATRRRR